MSQPPVSHLRWRIVGALLVVSLLPLVVVSGGAWVVVGRLMEDKSLQMQRSIVQGHARSIEQYLAERLRSLDLIARSQTVDVLRREEHLRETLAILNGSYGNAFVDLGVIDSRGDHLAYIGPYALGNQNYAQATWFQQTLQSGTHVSDVFLGVRGVPHCVIAVRRVEGERVWILRATINSEQFDALVRTGKLGDTGDAFLIGASGRYQTPPRDGKVLEQSPLRRPLRHTGVRDSRMVERGSALVRVTTWLNEGRWMLVVQQRESEIVAPVRQALLRGAIVVLLGFALIVIATFLATWNLTARLTRLQKRQDELNKDLLRSAKLASLGEMATGLAHEINNPLAIISAEQTNTSDLLGELASDTPHLEALRTTVSRCQRQVQRCARITAKMLQFGRQGDARPTLTDITPHLEETVQLMTKQAQVRNVELVLAVEPDLPRVKLDPMELEQVLVNLVTNALQATEGSGRITVDARRHSNDLLLSVADDGVGIDPDALDRVFLPFYTTKPPGQGTGLGLAVCYGVVQSWGAVIEAQSEPGQGTIMTIRIPIPGGSEGGQSRPRRSHDDRRNRATARAAGRR